MKKKRAKKRVELSLFVKLSIIIIASLLISNIFISASAMSIMEKVFIESYTISNGKILDQISHKLSDFNTKIAWIVNVYNQNMSLKECFTQDISDQHKLFHVYYNMKNHLKSIEQNSEYTDFHIATLGRNNLTFISSGDALTISDEELAVHHFTLQSKNNPNKIFYNHLFPGFTVNKVNKDVLIATKQLRDPYTSVNFGTIYIIFDEIIFSSMYENSLPEGSKLMVLSKDGKIVSSNDKKLLGETDIDILNAAEEHIKSDSQYTNIEYNQYGGILIAKYLPLYDMYMVNIVEKDYLLRGFIELQPLIYTGCFLISFIVITLVFLITRRITQPLTNLVSHMSKGKDGKFLKVTEIKGSYEVRELQHVYNLMVDEIDDYVERLISEQQERRKSEINALQMQINPHFLYNTLASIKYLSWQGDMQAVTDTINALIFLLQNTISKTDEKITVAKELQILESYVAINHVRYGEDIKVIYNVDENCLDCLIPKLIIQPFIENAFFHAYQEKQAGTIRIFMRCKGHKLICEVIDDGDGMNCEESHKLFESKDGSDHFSKIGIENVNRRLKLLYGEEFGVKINSKKGVGTTVTISIKYEQLGKTTDSK